MSSQIFKAKRNCAEANHFLLGCLPIIRTDVHCPDAVCQQNSGIAESDGVLDGIEHAVVGGEAADEEALNAGSRSGVPSKAE